MKKYNSKILSRIDSHLNLTESLIKIWEIDLKNPKERKIYEEEFPEPEKELETMKQEVKDLKRIKKIYKKDGWKAIEKEYNRLFA